MLRRVGIVLLALPLLAISACTATPVPAESPTSTPTSAPPEAAAPRPMPTNPYDILLPDAVVGAGAESCVTASGADDIEYWVEDIVVSVDLVADVDSTFGTPIRIVSCHYAFEWGFTVDLALSAGPACVDSEQSDYIELDDAAASTRCVGPDETFIATFQTPSGAVQDFIDPTWLTSLADAGAADAAFIEVLRAALPA